MKILYLASIQTCRGGFVFAALCIICCFISVQQAIANQQPQLALQLKHARGIGLAAATTDAQRFVSLGRDAGQRGNDVKEWDIASGLILRSWNAHYGRSFSTALSADGRLVATLNTTLSREGEIRLWDARTGQTLRVLPWQAEVAPIFGQECHLLFSPQGEWLVAIKADWRKIKKISLWNTSSGQLQWSYESKTQYGYQYNGKLKFSPDGSMLAVRAGIRTNDDHDLYTKVEILDVQKGNSRAELKKC
jgi:WD40 repeat protein